MDNLFLIFGVLLSLGFHSYLVWGEDGEDEDVSSWRHVLGKIDMNFWLEEIEQVECNNVANLFNSQ